MKIARFFAILLVGVSSPAAASGDYLDFDDTWFGTIECSDGPVAIKLQIDPYYDHSMSARATYGTATNGKPMESGVYTLKGRWENDGSFRLSPDRWIEQPEGYVMVGFDGRRTNNVFLGGLYGEVFGAPGCSNFAVKL